MGIIDDIKKMQIEGRQESDIANALQSRGYAPQEIYEALGQTKIKEAVGSASQISSMDENTRSNSQEVIGMQPSLLTSQKTDSQLPSPPASAYSPQEYQQEYSADQYAPQQEYAYSATSADTIAEIAEQVVAEKLHNLKQDIEKIIDMRTSLESKVSYLDERLKRIEKILDHLQLSILQKVGEYITNVEDIKNEIVQTQKSFKSLLPKNPQSE